jgi:diguanylate cyclase (GGDEF)-like protein/excisionase family DNA binding protein
MGEHMAQAPTTGSRPDALISVAQAAALLGVHPNTIRAWTESGRLAAWRINPRGDRRYRRADVERLLAEGTGISTDGHDTAPSGGARAPEPDAEAAVLTRISQGTVDAGSVASVCRVAVESLRTVEAVARVSVYLVRDERLVLETHSGHTVSPPATVEWPAEAEEFGPDGSIRLPLTIGQERIGLLVAADDQQGTFLRGRRRFMHAVAATTSVALRHARALARARRELTRARALASVTRELTGQLELGAVLSDIADRTRGLFDAERVGLWMINDEREYPFELAAERGLPPAFLAMVTQMTLNHRSLGIQAVRERRTFVARHADTDPTVGDMQAIYRESGIKTACLVPLVSHDRAVGVIGLYHARDREWPDDELALAQAFANQAAVAISNARLYRATAEQAARMRSIHDLSARLNRLTDVQAIADAIVAEASTLAAFHDIRVYATDWERGTCEPVAFTDRLLDEGDFRDLLRVDIGPGSFTGWVAANAKPILSNDALHDGRGLTIEGTDEIDESMLVVPMVYEGRSVGVIALSKLGIGQFSTDDLQTMMIFAGYAAQALVNARSYRRLEEQSSQLARQLESQRRLLDVSAQVMGTLEQKNVLEVVADGLKAVVHYDNLSIYRADPVKQVLLPVLTREEHAEEVARYIIPFGSGLMGWVVEHAEAVLANDALADPRALQIPGTPADQEALVVVPLMSDGQVTGSMNVSRVGGPEVYFTETDFELVQLFAAQASVALRNADEHHAMSLRAETDALTELGNHGAFQRDLAAAIESVTEAPIADGQLGLLMMDLDRFKSYNDHFGHPAGDALLRAVGEALYAATRADDRVYRYGGDEFTVVLAGIGLAEAKQVAERVRQQVAAAARERGAAPVTITIGVALFPDHGASKDSLIAAADGALYAGKQTGGDCVVVPGEAPRPRSRKPGPASRPRAAGAQGRRQGDARRARTSAA